MGWRSKRQADFEARAMRYAAFDVDRAGMGFNDGAAQGQAQADTRDRRFLRTARESLEQALSVDGRQARTVIFHEHMHGIRRRTRVNLHRRTCGRVFRGVVEHIDQDTLEADRIELTRGKSAARRVRTTCPANTLLSRLSALPMISSSACHSRLSRTPSL